MILIEAIKLLRIVSTSRSSLELKALYDLHVRLNESKMGREKGSNIRRGVFRFWLDASPLYLKLEKRV